MLGSCAVFLTSLSGSRAPVGKESVWRTRKGKEKVNYSRVQARIEEAEIEETAMGLSMEGEYVIY